MKILLIVTGSIAAIKSYDLVRQLIAQGHELHIVLTKAAQKFVTVEAMTILSQNKVYTDLFDLELEAKIGHIALSRDVDKILVAPATAHIMAQYAHGLCDDLATTLLAAANKPIYFAPAMNPVMWENKAHQDNLAILNHNPLVHLIEPEVGKMACGEVGQGRMAEVETIIDAIKPYPQPLLGNHILITAGPTVENIDPVRFISNYSSGKQGFSLAEEAVKLGAQVTLVAGPTDLDPPKGVNYVAVQTAEQMLNACEAALPVDIAICSAAVCDWKPEYQAHKLKKEQSNDNLMLNFTQNPDILAILSIHKKRPDYVIGFAAETDNLIENAKAKLIRKKCDIIYANLIDPEVPVFGADHNQIFEIRHDGHETLEYCSKNMVAQWILQRILSGDKD